MSGEACRSQHGAAGLAGKPRGCSFLWVCVSAVRCNSVSCVVLGGGGSLTESDVWIIGTVFLVFLFLFFLFFFFPARADDVGLLLSGPSRDGPGIRPVGRTTRQLHLHHLLQRNITHTWMWRRLGLQVVESVGTTLRARTCRVLHCTGYTVHAAVDRDNGPSVDAGGGLRTLQLLCGSYAIQRVPPVVVFYHLSRFLVLGVK